MTQAKVLGTGQKPVGLLPGHEVGAAAVTSLDAVFHCRGGGAEEPGRVAVRGGSASTVALDEAEGDSDVTQEPALSETNQCLQTAVHSGLEPISPVPVVKEARTPGLTPSSGCTIGLQSPALEGPAAGTLQRRRLLMAFSHPAVCNDEKEIAQPKAAHPTKVIDQTHQAPRVRLRAELPRSPQACGEAYHPLTASARHAAASQMGHAENAQRMRLCAELPVGQPVYSNASATAAAATVAAAAATAAAATYSLTPPHMMQCWPQGQAQVHVQEAQIHRVPQQTPQLQSRQIWMTSPMAVQACASRSSPGPVQVPVEAGPVRQASGGIGASVGVAPPASSRAPTFHTVTRGASFAIHSGAAQPALVASLPQRLCKGVSAGVAAAAPRVQSFAVHSEHVSWPAATVVGQAHYAGQIPSRLPPRVHSFAPCTPSLPAPVHSFSVQIAPVSEAQRLEAMRRAIAESGIR